MHTLTFHANDSDWVVNHDDDWSGDVIIRRKLGDNYVIVAHIHGAVFIHIAKRIIDRALDHTLDDLT